MRGLWISVCIAAVLWFVMFSPWTSGTINFWTTMALAAILLSGLSLYYKPEIKKRFSLNLRDVFIGLASAALLWVVFFIGDYVSAIIFDFAKPQVGGIYSMKEGTNPWMIGAVLLFLIGPAEEIFWRGFVQERLSEAFGKWSGFIFSTLIYALVHIWSFNFMLVMAALVCGAFWGLLYMYNRNLTTLIISHAVWDVAVFLLFPIL